MKAAKVRNKIAVMAIALTTLLFTAFFTIVMSIMYSFEQSNFRQIGGYDHGEFKYLTEKQFDELKDDSLIKEYSLRRFVGMPMNVPFHKAHVEVSYCDINAAKWMYIEPEEGYLPEENTNEAATDTRVLELLGVEPKLGTQFTMTFEVDGVETTQTFTLCGWWEYDEAIYVSHVLIPQSRAEEIYAELDTQGKDGITGTYNMGIMLKSAAHIEKDLQTILKRHGYQSNSRTEGDNYINIGVNWGYVTAQLSDAMDAGTIVALVVVLVLIVFTGYLIIYNVFQISISNDIRSYGLLKTIGTTGKQIRRMVRIQALVLAGIGIPIGLVAGYSIGAVLTPGVLNSLDGIHSSDLSVSPWIFIGAVVFALVTVFFSCRKPAKMAASVSPMEALRYTEGGGSKKKQRRARKGASITQMAFANLGRNKKKTVITIVSLSLAVALFQITVIFTNGFDMDKYLRNVVVDFQVADARYFQSVLGAGGFQEEQRLTEEMIAEIKDMDGILDGGCTYAGAYRGSQFVTEESYRKWQGRWLSEEEINQLVALQHKENGLIQDAVQLYGMEPFCLGKLQVLSGDISKLYTEGNYIAAVYLADDYGNPQMDTHWAKTGDKVTIRYTQEYEYYNPETGEVYAAGEDLTNKLFTGRSSKYHDVEYEVVAEVVLPNNLSYRYYSRNEYILGADAFIKDTQTDNIMYYAFDVKDSACDEIEAYLQDYTEKVQPMYDYESKKIYEEEFESFRTMFLLMGTALSFIAGMVGVLNFCNAILTGIMARHREFAVLQSVGMTGGQLKRMLVIEGLCYALGSIGVALMLFILTTPFLKNLLNDMFWFFTYRFTSMPILVAALIFSLLGILVPLVVYKYTAKKSIVERLREVE